MDYTQLLAALQQDSAQKIAANPYLTGAQEIGSLSPFKAGNSSAKNIGQAALQGFLSGLGGSMGKARYEQEIGDRNTALSGFFKAPDEQHAEMLKSDTLKPFAGFLSAIDDERQQKQLAKTQSENADFSKAIALKQIDKMDPRAVTNAKWERLPDGSYKVTPGEGSPIGKSVNEDPSMQSRTMRIFQDLKNQGYPDTQAATTANALMEQERKKMGSTLKAVEASREKAAQLESMAQTAEQAIAGAGRTGALSSDWGASILGTLGIGDQAEKAAATTLLNSVKPSALAANKVPGMGSMSDFESRAFFAAAPGSDKLPEQNMVLVNKMKQAAQLENEHADFLETYIGEKGTDKGAQQTWNAYKKANPLIIRDPASGDFVVNENRTPWAEYFGGGSEPIQAIGPSVTDRAEKQAGGGAELVGYTPEQITFMRQKGMIP